MLRGLPRCGYVTERHRASPSTLLLRFILNFYFYFDFLCWTKNAKQLNPGLFVKLSPCPARVSRRLLMKLRLKLKQEVSSFCMYIFIHPLLALVYFSTPLPPLFSERDPGSIDSLADLLLSDMKNFPRVRELRETSARFI